MPTSHSILILSTRPEEADEATRALSPLGYAMRSRILPSAEFLSATGEENEICVYLMPRDYAISSAQRTPPEASDRERACLYVIPDGSVGARAWAFRHGAMDVLAAPWLPSQLRSRIERIFVLHQRASHADIPEAELIGFLKACIAHGRKEIAPAIDPLLPMGHCYPEAMAVLGDAGSSAEALERLADEGLLSRSLVNRIRLCPVCDDHHLNYREVCPSCASIDIRGEEMIHHFACGHVNSIGAFRQESDLVCPKCRATLRHIGLDYEKPGVHFVCAACKHIAAEPKVEAQCLWCGHISDPEQTIERPIWTYALTPLAASASAEGRLQGADLSALLRSRQTGLSTRQFFLHTLEREIQRSGRYREPLTLMLVRLESFDHVQREHAAHLDEFAHSVFQAVTRGLRTLDLTAVLEKDLLAVLLPGTAPEEARVVAERMEKQVAGLEHLLSIHKPEVTASIVGGVGTFRGAEEMIRAARAELETKE
ncbi:MAG: diguanylate cyclase [Planctomycetota bacterium]